MRSTVTVLIGKLVRFVAKLRGGGSALPGLVAERIDPGFMARSLAGLPLGVVVVSGTNGKTSTTKMITEVLEHEGIRVFTNRTGSNFSRGVVSAILGECSPRGKLRADIAVLELDEAHAMHFIDRVKPNAALLLNVFLDQIERFSDVSVTAGLLQRIADATSDTVVLNADDPHVSRIQADGRAVHAFGLGPSVKDLFPREDQGVAAVATNVVPVTPEVRLMSLNGNDAVFDLDGEHISATLDLVGAHNYVNAAAALALVRAVLELHGRSFSNTDLVAALTAVRPAFGRGERVTIDGDEVELMMVKNAAGLRMSLLGLDSRAEIMLAINNQVSDGTDVSWLRNVDVSRLRTQGVTMVSGSQAHFAAGVLEAADVQARHVDTELTRAVQRFLEATRGKPKQIFASYTAIMQLREVLRLR